VRAPLTALFGGTFDPVHYGHLRAAWEVREFLGVETFRFLPAGQPPHRPEPVTDARHRVAMLELALADWPGSAVDRREVDRAGPSYMTDTLKACRQSLGDAPLALVVGEDSAATLDTWHLWQDLPELAHLVIMRRPGPEQPWSGALRETMAGRRVHDVEALRSRPAGHWLTVQVTPLDISSSGIRAMLQAGRSPRFLLPPAVLSYIRRHGLYGCATA